MDSLAINGKYNLSKLSLKMSLQKSQIVSSKNYSFGILFMFYSSVLEIGIKSSHIHNIPIARHFPVIDPRYEDDLALILLKESTREGSK